MFSSEQQKLLNEPLLKDHVKTREGSGKTQLSYLPSHHVIAEANRIFGFDAWGTEVTALRQVDRTEYEKPPYKAGDKPKEMVSISYMCELRLTVNAGGQTVTKEDVGFGNGVAGNNAFGIGSCIELASKEAVTDALKRCMRYFGDKFGLSLYDKDEVLMYSDDYELSKPVTDEQLDELRALYDKRGIDDEWVLRAIKAENYQGDSLNDMRQDWFELALKITENYKKKEIEAENYKADIDNVIKLMKESASMNMLKALFKEAWEKTKSQDDKEKQLECQKTYESMKEKFSK